ncbi:CCA tRNA nucleotidyltransferase 1, mitochondrial [Nymphon striatum]|nr:CCA tRNA nucleotidyltransferase 1, mitochondrial [Nymphon striatum]
MSDGIDCIRAALAQTGKQTSDFDLNADVVLPEGRALRPAGVLAPIVERDGRLHLMLTKRSSALKHHPGQIAFPGGKQDEADHDVIAAALREAREEIGLPEGIVDVLGTLPIHETVTGFSVTPVIAFVRDTFEVKPEPGEPVSDVDMSTNARPEQVMEIAKAAGLKAIPTGIDHGTITVVVRGTPFEITTFRRDVATDGRRAVVSFSNDIADDARRRDFTMNALYAAPDGRVIDPLHGIDDLLARRITFIEDPTARIKEDYLRVLSVLSLFGRDDRMLGILVHMEKSLGLSPDAMRRLAVLGGEDVQARFRLSKSDTQTLTTLRDTGFVGPKIEEIAYRFGEPLAQSEC